MELSICFPFPFSASDLQSRKGKGEELIILSLILIVLLGLYCAPCSKHLKEETANIDSAGRNAKEVNIQCINNCSVLLAKKLRRRRIDRGPLAMAPYIQ
jgi:hypothetical protein